MPDLPGELEDSERSVEGSVWHEVRGGLPNRLLPPGDTTQPDEMDVSGAVAPPLHLEQSDHWLGRIALYYVAHPTIPNLYQCCFDYVEPWDWSRQTERIATGRWIYRTAPANG
jgi:hypothetical protein